MRQLDLKSICELFCEHCIGRIAAKLSLRNCITKCHETSFTIKFNEIYLLNPDNVSYPAPLNIRS